ncbi:high-potential iron-sulfur protein [Burkholderiaceae bacterium DAT-1]|nr:high-potential iron-sulfur protein [Burkholderiaceae bacterium DAT-1]
MNARRQFMLKLIPAAGLAAVAPRLLAAGPDKVSEADQQAQSLGYKLDAGKVDKSKFPKFAAGQACSGCQLFQGKPADAFAPCPIFAGKLVAGKGWCSAWVKKA